MYTSPVGDHPEQHRPSRLIPQQSKAAFILMGIAFQFTKSMALSLSIPLFCYVVVASYAFWGSQFTASRRFAGGSSRGAF
jgi:hypothetical protein